MPINQSLTSNGELPPKKRKSLWTHLIAGGGAGLVESCTCHPFDTVKVRMQLRGELPSHQSHKLPVKRLIR